MFEPQNIGSTERRHICKNCGKSYAQYSSLYTHRRYECGKQATLKCPYCSYKSKLKGNLKVHVKNQHPKLPYPPKNNNQENIPHDDNTNSIDFSD